MSLGCDSMGIIFCVERTFQGELSTGNFALGGFDRIHLRNSFCLSFSMPTQFCMWRCSWGIVRRKFSACLDFREMTLMDGGISGVIGKTIRT